MDGRLECVGASDGPASSELLGLGAAAMVTETVVEQVVQARGAGRSVAAWGDLAPTTAEAPALAQQNTYNHILHMSNPTRTLSVTDAARRFADVVNRAFYRHETTVLLKNGLPVAFVAPMAPSGIPATELAHRWALLPRLAPSDATGFGDDIADARVEFAPPSDPWS